MKGTFEFNSEIWRYTHGFIGLTLQ